ncbi:CopZ family metallochaperone [Desulfotruncus alcoholivorax]|uniref:CopZ family metallochaperone n=1 Tax=Desulfotruncus alcoholivorax TaxID=265477 RepID=UPI00040B7F08|nr:cation transporter [Desulfotruncus alcoholivorax]
MSQTVLKVEGMSCNHCKMAVEKALKAVSGVENAQVNLDKKEVVVTGTADRDKLAKAIEDAGYTVVK